MTEEEEITGIKPKVEKTFEYVDDGTKVVCVCVCSFFRTNDSRLSFLSVYILRT